MDERIDSDVRRAATLPGAAYHDPAVYARQVERIFARSWQWIPVAPPAAEGPNVVPFDLLPGSLDEPLVLVRDDAGAVRCLSNVCTHRAALVVTERGSCGGLRCPYHGRRFALDGTFRAMPGFDGAQEFPSSRDDLPRLPLERWGPFGFTAIAPAIPFDALVEPLARRVGWLPVETFRPDGARQRDYLLDAHWALYCDNYLEGLHIPFVHRGLAAGLEFGAYRSEPLPYGSLQIAIARDGEPVFELPAGHPEHGLAVAAFYFWLFPNLMLNFYPWGLSLNLVEPLGPRRTRIRYFAYVHRPEREGQGAGGDLDRVELEDQAVVLSCQRGVRSRLYDRGRYSPAHERGVHRFHRLVQHFLEDAEGAP